MRHVIVHVNDNYPVIGGIHVRAGEEFPDGTWFTCDGHISRQEMRDTVDLQGLVDSTRKWCLEKLSEAVQKHENKAATRIH